jgi:hypothetical protein
VQLLTIENYVLAGRYGTWSPKGWYLLLDGTVGGLPADLSAADQNGRRTSEGADIWLEPYSSGWAGGKIFWNWDFGRAEVYYRGFNGPGGVGSTWVGRPHRWGAEADGGWNIGYTAVGTYAGGLRRWTQITVQPVGGWFGNWAGTNIACPPPWWAGKIYPEGPPLPGGQPPAP